jgi:hypothetical protein
VMLIKSRIESGRMDEEEARVVARALSDLETRAVDLRDSIMDRVEGEATITRLPVRGGPMATIPDGTADLIEPEEPYDEDPFDEEGRAFDAWDRGDD